MKKRVVLVATIAVLQFSITAFAVPAATDTDNVTATTNVTGTDSYSTVLIKDSENNIVYLNQADSFFGGASDFLLQANPSYGKYTVLLGNSSDQSASTYLYVGVPQGNSDVRMKRFQNEEASEKGGYNIGYYSEVGTNVINNYNSLKVGYSDAPTYGGFDLQNALGGTDFSGDGSLYIIFQLDNVPAAVKDSMTVSLSPDELGTEKVTPISG